MYNFLASILLLITAVAAVKIQRNSQKSQGGQREMNFFDFYQQNSQYITFKQCFYYSLPEISLRL